MKADILLVHKCHAPLFGKRCHCIDIFGVHSVDVVLYRAFLVPSHVRSPGYFGIVGAAVRASGRECPSCYMVALEVTRLEWNFNLYYKRLERGKYILLRKCEL